MIVFVLLAILIIGLMLMIIGLWSIMLLVKFVDWTIDCMVKSIKFFFTNRYIIILGIIILTYLLLKKYNYC